MRIDERAVDVVMPEQGANHLQVEAVRYPDSGEVMAQVMEPKGGSPDCFPDLLPGEIFWP